MIRTISKKVTIIFGLILATAALLLPSPALAQTATNYQVLTRGKGDKEFDVFGYYETEAFAKTIREHLEGSGFDVEVRSTTQPIPTITVACGPETALPLSETVTYAKAREVFQWMARQQDIAFRYPKDGCYARAELMIERLRQQRYAPRRVWSVANGEPLFARTRNTKAGYVTWGYHVAPMLRVRTGANTQRWYVIDPSLFRQPATVAEWQGAQMRSRYSRRPYLTLSRIGEPPVWINGRRKPGTGYWPGNDPREGLHTHALITMRRYKPYEGRSLADIASEPGLGFGTPTFMAADSELPPDLGLNEPSDK